MWSHYSLALTTLLGTALAAFGWALLIFYGGTSIPPGLIQWPWVLSKLALCLTAFILLSVAVLVPARRTIGFKLALGFGLLFLGCWQGLLNSLVENPGYLSRALELGPPPLGLLIAALGLHQLGKAYRKNRVNLTGYRQIEQELSTVDQLTQLYNRPQFFTLGSRLLAKWKPEQEPPQVIWFRILNLTKINQTLGFQAGDRVLEQVARAIKRHTRPEDIAGRLGARRLVVLLPSATRLNTKQIAERVAKRSAHMILPDGKGAETPQHIEVEIVIREAQPGENLDALLKRAGAVASGHEASCP